MATRRDRMEHEGTVLETSNGLFQVQVSDSYTATCTLSGKIRVNQVRILVGDKVVIEVSPYDPSKGRIVYRCK